MLVTSIYILSELLQFAGPDCQPLMVCGRRPSVEVFDKRTQGAPGHKEEMALQQHFSFCLSRKRYGPDCSLYWHSFWQCQAENAVACVSANNKSEVRASSVTVNLTSINRQAFWEIEMLCYLTNPFYNNKMSIFVLQSMVFAVCMKAMSEVFESIH